MKKFFAVTLILGLLLSASALLAGNSAYQDIQWFNELSAGMELSSPSVGLIIREALPGSEPVAAYDSSTTLSVITGGTWGIDAQITDGGMPQNTDLALTMDFKEYSEQNGEWGYYEWGAVTDEVYDNSTFDHDYPCMRIGILYTQFQGGPWSHDISSDANRRLYYRFSANSAAPVQSFSRTILFTLACLNS